MGDALPSSPFRVTQRGPHPEGAPCRHTEACLQKGQELEAWEVNTLQQKILSLHYTRTGCPNFQSRIEKKKKKQKPHNYTHKTDYKKNEKYN